MQSLVDENINGSKAALLLLEDYDKMNKAFLIYKNIIKLSAVAITTYTAMKFDTRWIWLVISILILIILVFGEIVPKSISTLKAEKLALKIALPILFLTKLLTPVIFIINKLCNGVLLLLRIDLNELSSMTENDLRSIVEVSHNDGVLESEERRIINNVVDFGDSLAKDVMVPRIDMAFASADLSYDELVQVFAVDKYTRLPVYSENRDNVIGIINLKDLFFYTGKKEDFKIQDIMREPYFTYEFKRPLNF